MYAKKIDAQNIFWVYICAKISYFEVYYTISVSIKDTDIKYANANHAFIVGTCIKRTYTQVSCIGNIYIISAGTEDIDIKSTLITSIISHSA